jgi:hypothetical protein
MGFSDNWLTWIKIAVAGGTLSVKNNDQTGPYFGSFKGVRQGDPFAPALFNIAVNCLAKMIHRAQQNGLIKGLAEHLVDGGLQFCNMLMIQFFSYKMIWTTRLISKSCCICLSQCLD